MQPTERRASGREDSSDRSLARGFGKPFLLVNPKLRRIKAVSRNRKPLRDTVSIEGAMNKWIYPAIGDLPLALVDNLTVKPLVEKMCAGGLKPRTVNKYRGVHQAGRKVVERAERRTCPQEDMGRRDDGSTRR